MATEVQSGTMLARGFDWDSVRFRGRRIGDVASLSYGKSLLEPTRRPGLVPVYGTNGPCGYHDTPLSEGPGVVLGRKGQGHLGVKWVNKPFWVIDTAYYASVNKTEVDLRWFYFITNYVGLDHLKTGEKPGLNRDTFGRQVFPFPEIDEQRAIARVLGALDDKIELNRRVNRTLEELAAALFRSWFVDFDPVVAKAAGRKPAHLRPGLAALFPATFQDSELGPIPQGWTAAKINGAVSLIIDHRGKTPTKLGGVWSDSGIPAVSAKNIKAGRLVSESSMGFVSRELYEKWMKEPLEAGDTLLTSEAPLGELLYLLEQVEWCLSQRLFALRPNRAACVPTYLYCWLSSTEGQAELEARSSGTTVMGIRQSELRTVPILLPPLPLQEKAEAMLEPWFKQIWHNERESRTLAALRDTLLPKLLSGELRVKQAEKQIEAMV